MSEEEENWILSSPDGQRIIEMRTDIITELRRDVAAILSVGVARQLFYRWGLAAGKTFVSRMNGKLNEESCWRVAEEVVRSHGWTRLVDHSKSVLGNGNLRITVICEKSAFALDVKSNEPVCDIIRGGLAASLWPLYDMNLVTSGRDNVHCSGESEVCLRR